MIETINEIVIQRPLEVVWPYVGQPERWHTWRDEMVGPIRQKAPDQPLKIGHNLGYESQFLGRPVETTLEVAEHDPPHCIGFIMRSGPIAGEVVLRCQASAEGTQVRQEGTIEIADFFDLAEPLARPLLERQFQQDLQRLKELLEAEG